MEDWDWDDWDSNDSSLITKSDKEETKEEEPQFDEMEGLWEGFYGNYEVYDEEIFSEPSIAVEKIKYKPCKKRSKLNHYNNNIG
jgi:hypothetical protein